MADAARQCAERDHDPRPERRRRRCCARRACLYVGAIAADSRGGGIRGGGSSGGGRSRRLDGSGGSAFNIIIIWSKGRQVANWCGHVMLPYINRAGKLTSSPGGASYAAFGSRHDFRYKTTDEEEAGWSSKGLQTVSLSSSNWNR